MLSFKFSPNLLHRHRSKNLHYCLPIRRRHLHLRPLRLSFHLLRWLLRRARFCCRSLLRSAILRPWSPLRFKLEFPTLFALKPMRLYFPPQWTLALAWFLLPDDIFAWIHSFRVSISFYHRRLCLNRISSPPTLSLSSLLQSTLLIMTRKALGTSRQRMAFYLGNTKCKRSMVFLEVKARFSLFEFWPFYHRTAVSSTNHSYFSLTYQLF